MKTIRLIILICFLYQMGFTQDPILKFTYEQTVTSKSSGESPSKELGGIVNSFQPILLSLVESKSDLKKEVWIEGKKLYVLNYLLSQEGIFSIKLDKRKKTYYLNPLTGEEKEADTRNLAFIELEIPTKFKLKNKKSSEKDQLEIYQAENKDMLIEYQVHTDQTYAMNSNLSKEFLYNKKLILKSTTYIKAEDKEIVNTLISIDTIENESLDSYINLNRNRKFQLANLKLANDSIPFNTSIPDMYVNQIGEDAMVSLNQYKGNGKYLMVDFWGTWCKPCLAAVPKLKSFYEKYTDQMDLLALNYNDSNVVRIKEKIKEYEMEWDHASVSEKVMKILNPSVHFPGILLFDDQMRLVVRDKSSVALIKAEEILRNRN
ncbi:MAG: TlpA disulfide reductase family protein [Bacteroidota bacterium]